MLVLAAQRRLTYCADMIFFYGIIIRDDILYIQSSRRGGELGGESAITMMEIVAKSREVEIEEDGEEEEGLWVSYVNKILLLFREREGGSLQ